MTGWYATRDFPGAQRDEDAGHAYIDYGEFFSRNDARQALLNGIEREIDSWKRMGQDSGAEEETRRILLDNDDLDEVYTSRGVRFRVWSRNGRCY